tara:strand:+ start:232 stop:1338 length:1107 start_codon:yes stop_codon:yes gene_type:complete
MKKIIKSIIKIPVNIVKGVGKLIKTIANFTFEIVKAFGRMIVFIVKSPLLLAIQTYNKGILIRDWVMVKVDYLDSESKKWHRFFQTLALPYNALLKLGFSPQMAMSFLAVGSTVGTGVVVNETILAERSFSNRDAGVYLAPSDMPNSELEEQFKEEVTTNTLRVLLNDTPVETISISDVNVGTSFASKGQPSALPSGKTEAILIDGNNTRIEIGKLVFSRNSCTTLVMTNINSNKTTIKDNQADGLSIYQTASSTIPNLRISGGYYMADLLQTQGGLYDRIHISPLDSISSSKVYVNELNLTNIVSSGGSCTLNKLDVGEIEITFNRVGGDSSLVSKALTVSSTVTSANWVVDGNVEVLMAPVERKPD